MQSKQASIHTPVHNAVILVWIVPISCETTVEFLIILTPSFSSKRWYSNSFVHVKMKLIFYCSYSKNASTVRWRFWHPELWVNTFFCSWCRSYDQGCQWRRRFQPSLASYTLRSVVRDYSSRPCSFATQVSPSLTSRQANAVELPLKVLFSLFDGSEVIAQLTSGMMGKWCNV